MIKGVNLPAGIAAGDPIAAAINNAGAATVKVQAYGAVSADGIEAYRVGGAAARDAGNGAVGCSS